MRQQADSAVDRTGSGPTIIQGPLYCEVALLEKLHPPLPAFHYGPLSTHRKCKASVTRSGYCSLKREGTADASVLLSVIGTNTLQELSH